jgi:hypothetical protein
MLLLLHKQFPMNFAILFHIIRCAARLRSRLSTTFYLWAIVWFLLSKQAVSFLPRVACIAREMKIDCAACELFKMHLPSAWGHNFFQYLKTTFDRPSSSRFEFLLLSNHVDINPIRINHINRRTFFSIKLFSYKNHAAALTALFVHLVLEL